MILSGIGADLPSVVARTGPKGQICVLGCCTPPCMLWEATSDHHGRVLSCARRADVPGLPWTAQTVPTPIINDKRRYGLGKAASGVATIIV